MNAERREFLKKTAALLAAPTVAGLAGAAAGGVAQREAVGFTGSITVHADVPTKFFVNGEPIASDTIEFEPDAYSSFVTLENGSQLFVWHSPTKPFALKRRPGESEWERIELAPMES